MRPFILLGAVLASPLNKLLFEAMVKLMKSNQIECGAFTGIHATFSKGDFSSVEGKQKKSDMLSRGGTSMAPWSVRSACDRGS
jgi:thiamine biosynthesis protein ThiC